VPWSQLLPEPLFDQLDWCLMVYAVIVGVSHAVAYYHEAQQRKLKSAQLETHLVEARLKTLERSSIRTFCSTRSTPSRRSCTAIPSPPTG
jgi:hypothetical protein